MKHDLKITIILLLIFVIAQVIGLLLVNADIQDVSVVNGKTTISHDDTSLGPRPEMTGLGAFSYVVIGIALGTILVLLIIKIGKVSIWKVWFFLAVFIALSLALGVVIKNMWVFAIAALLAVFKVWKPNIILHNITEVLMYAGIAVFLVPILNVFWMFILLIAISIYDVIAVFKSKHMVKMAQFQARSNLFAGLSIPYSTHKKNKKIVRIHGLKKISPSKTLAKPTVKKGFEHRTAILGGGDVAFPLLFSGVVMESLILSGVSKASALSQSLIITLTTTIALGLLFYLAKKDKFYPAMPFVTGGCILGYLIILVIQIL